MLIKFAKDIIDLSNSAELTGMHEHSLGVGGFGKRGASIFANNRVITKLSSPSCGAQDAHIAEHSDNNNGRNTHVTQGVIEEGAVETARSELVDQYLVISR